MLPDRVSNPGPLTYESGSLPIALRGLAPSSLLMAAVLLVLYAKIQGLVVQSIVSLTSSLRGQLVKRLPLFNQIHLYFLLKK